MEECRVICPKCRQLVRSVLRSFKVTFMELCYECRTGVKLKRIDGSS